MVVGHQGDDDDTTERTGDCSERESQQERVDVSECLASHEQSSLLMDMNFTRTACELGSGLPREKELPVRKLTWSTLHAYHASL